MGILFSQYTPSDFTNIDSDKSNILGRDVERMKNIERLYIQVVVWLVWLVVWLVVCNAGLTQLLLWPRKMSKSSHVKQTRFSWGCSTNTFVID